jgi:hypothetical protein
MDTCSAALDYYFHLLTIITVVSGFSMLFNFLLFVVIYYMSRGYARLKAKTFEALTDAGYFNDI